MAETVVKYLLKRPEVFIIFIKNRIHIASNIISEAKNIVDRNDGKRLSYSEVDVTNDKSISQLISKA